MSLIKQIQERRALLESFQQIDELSRKTLSSYVKKSAKSAERHYDKASKEEDKAMATDGNKYPDKQKRHNAAAADHLRKWNNREDGQKRAKKKLSEEIEIEENGGFTDAQLDAILEEMTVEEYEQLDELSKNTLSSYAIKAAASKTKNGDLVYHHDNHGEDDKAKKADKKFENRHHGIKKAVDKLSK